MWAKLDQYIVRVSNDVELLGVTIDNNLRLDKHVSVTFLKANWKLSPLTRVVKFILFQERKHLQSHSLDTVHLYGCFMEGKSMIS